ncbi:MAG: DegT/DnrJ/EryC1/StrS family aminotransferase [Candidatus Acidiferrales bacterium]|jgi:perosamine synthetase
MPNATTAAATAAPATTKIRIPQFAPLLGDQELAQLRECIETAWLTEGPKTAEFIARLAALTGAKHVILAPNGTLALYMALAVCGIGPGDEVIVPDFTFLGSASSIALTGARPVFADVSPETFNFEVDAVRRALSPRTRAIMPVHIYGQAAEMTPLLELAEQEDLFVIEDAAQGIGVLYQNRHAGTLGDLGCLSFFADKTITTGEGGAILTSNDEFAGRLQYFRNQGRLSRGSFIHPQMGWNFRLTDLQSGIGIAQLDRLKTIIERKRQIEDLYKSRLAGLENVKFPVAKEPQSRVPFRMNILVPDPEKLSEHLTREGIGVRRFFYPLHRQPCFNEQNSRIGGEMVNSIAAFDRGLSLPSSVKLTEHEIDTVCEAISAFFQ